jgi:putative peptide zinc metalloprotease protein
VIRLVRRIWTATLRRTAGHPVKRAVAAVCAFAVVAALVVIWWPRGDYRPIQPGERGTIGDAVSATFTQPLGGAASRPELTAGSTLSRSTIWPSGLPLPDKAHKALAVVLTPRSGTGPTWVFPFNRPAAPGPGDNQSMAVVTKDGAVAYDVSLALVWATGDTVLNKNEAYAFASCVRCAAVAISFQVVLVIGHANVAAPQNIAAAVNYNCVRCVAEALAAQLVLTLPERPTGDLAAELERLWKQIAAFGQHLSGLSFAQIKARLQQYEQQIVHTLQPLLPSTAPSPSASTSSAATQPPATGTSSASTSTSTSPPAAATSTSSTASTTPPTSTSPPPTSTSSAPTSSP